ncbi:hypothetical protein TIFTF001_015000 [Ficus carica]|uniref:Uncharacterized protein n=1 Tax=Ficus carica TaxID=3494 RepID=A0AA88D4M7_FICCA|nr:hypothetical protein TIFTF001_015000 [Ficus carica]
MELGRKELSLLLTLCSKLLNLHKVLTTIRYRNGESERASSERQRVLLGADGGDLLVPVHYRRVVDLRQHPLAGAEVRPAGLPPPFHAVKLQRLRRRHRRRRGPPIRQEQPRKTTPDLGGYGGGAGVLLRWILLHLGGGGRSYKPAIAAGDVLVRVLGGERTGVLQLRQCLLRRPGFLRFRWDHRRNVEDTCGCMDPTIYFKEGI